MTRCVWSWSAAGRRNGVGAVASARLAGAPAGRADQRDGTRFDRAEGALLPTAFRARAENLYRPAGSLNTRDRAVGGILGDVVRAITVFVALIRRAVIT